MQGIASINLEAILASTNPGGSVAQIKLNCIDPSTNIELDSSNISDPTILKGSNITGDYVLVRSDDIKDQLLGGQSDFIYQVSMASSGGNLVSCLMVRLVITYDNPSWDSNLAQSENFVPYLP